MRRFLQSLTVLFVAVAAASPAARQERIVVPEPPPRTVGIARDPGSTTATREVPIGTAEISGVVIAAGNGRPLANVRLNLSGTSRVTSTSAPAPPSAPGAASTVTPTGVPLSRTAVSDDQGRFVFDALPAGGFILSANKEQYLGMSYGAKAPTRPGTMIPITDGQRVSVSLGLVHGGVITGTIYAQDGEPLTGAQVRALRLMYASGVRRPQMVSAAATDDRGVYRIANLTPGEYFLSAAPNGSAAAEMGRTEDIAFHAALQAARQGGRTPSSIALPMNALGRVDPPLGFVPTYHPSASTLASAVVIPVAGGEERIGVDITVLPIRAANVNGIVAGNPPNTAVQVGLVSDDPLSDTGQQSSARTANDGTFTLRNVSPGQYTIYAQVVPGPVVTQMADGRQTVTTSQQIEPAARLWATAALTVDGQTSPRVVLTLQPPRTVSGSITFDPSVTSARRGTVMVTLGPSPGSRLPLMGGPPQVQVASDGTFAIAGVPAGTYAVRTSVGPITSAVVNGQDVLDSPFVVEGDRDVSGLALTIGGRRSELKGRLTDAAGTAAPDYTVIVAAEDRRYWTPNSRRIATTRPDVDGRYTFTGLPAGEYLVAVVSDIEPGGQFDPEFLSSLGGAAVHVTITDGGTHVQDVRIGR